jgi:RNA polymerase sigma factor (sigma-70 family)
MSSRRKETADNASHAQNTERHAREALERGDRKMAVDILMRGYGNRIYRYCMTTLSDPIQAEDVLQEVFVSAYKGMSSFDGVRDFLPWLRRIASRRCADALRKNGRWNRLFIVEKPLLDDPDPRLSGDELLTYKWLVSELNRCIDRAPPRYRMELALRFREGLSYTEMAEILKVPAATLQIRVSRLMAMFRRRLIARGIRP